MSCVSTLAHRADIVRDKHVGLAFTDSACKRSYTTDVEDWLFVKHSSRQSVTDGSKGNNGMRMPTLPLESTRGAARLSKHRGTSSRRFET